MVCFFLHFNWRRTSGCWGRRREWPQRYPKKTLCLIVSQKTFFACFPHLKSSMLLKNLRKCHQMCFEDVLATGPGIITSLELGSCDNPPSCKRLQPYLLWHLDPCPTFQTTQAHAVPFPNQCSGTGSPVVPMNATWSGTAEKREISWWSLDLHRLVCKVYQNTKNSSVFTLGAGGASQLLPCPPGLLVFVSVPVWSHWYQSAGRLQTPPSSNNPPGLALGQNGAVNRPVIVQIFPAWSKFYMNISYRQFSVESSNLVKSALPRSCHLGWPPEITEIASVFPTQDGWFICSLIFSSPVFTAGSSILCCWHFNPDEF